MNENEGRKTHAMENGKYRERKWVRKLGTKSKRYSLSLLEVEVGQSQVLVYVLWSFNF
jgi:hypothetical protein